MRDGVVWCWLPRRTIGSLSNNNRGHHHIYINMSSFFCRPSCLGFVGSRKRWGERERSGEEEEEGEGGASFEKEANHFMFVLPFSLTPTSSIVDGMRLLPLTKKRTRNGGKKRHKGGVRDERGKRKPPKDDSGCTFFWGCLWQKSKG